MGSNWSIEPIAEYYACMVDFLGRVGHVHEAMDMIRNMPIEAEAVVWGSILDACKTHKKTGHCWDCCNEASVARR